MKKIFTILTFTCLFAISLPAQIDQVSVGSGYSQQAYYSLSTGDVETVANDSWDISFSAIGQQDAGVFFNESVSFMSTPVQVFLTDSKDWSEDITNTDGFVDSVALYNPDLNWTEGAFNTMKDPTSPFDYGWGTYNPQSNIVEGNKIFAIKGREGSFFKMQIESLAGGIYSMRYADLDGGNEKTYEANKADTENGMIYFSFVTEQRVDMPSEYDLIFQRYTTPLDAGDGTFLEYNVTGVLLANGVEAVVVDGVDPVTISESDYSDQYSTLPMTIGHTWKSFNFTQGWLVDEDRTHFVKNKNGDIYQITFYDFEGSGTGTTTLERTLVTSVSTVNKTNANYNISVSPNPTTDYFSINSEEQNSIEVVITNINGQFIRRCITRTNEPISTYGLKMGVYNLTILSSEFMTTKRVVIR